MKKNIINLLINREDYQKYENLFERLKLTATILTIILAILFTYFYISIKNKFNIYEKMNLQKKTYLQMLTNRRGDEAKINYIEKKYSDLKNFLKDDASSVTYFEILSDSIKNSSESARLKSLEVDKTRNTSFTITFSVFEKMMDFLKFAESEVFLNNFENISLKNLIIVGDNKSQENYELSFTGKFIPVKPENNEK
ncbi:MAG: hypothetical protein UR56_C0026G0003 [Candidatus Roizmanbacteria bacterium GW2011_GWC2_34_23]|uniref:Uncharacterized protein n=1 Tax=Candidatus Roizmanbacteria bacterium GW2011_GWC2_34_23 TaxID=1618484 RepID=A0A0G0DA69_9BACT|nr:MAG: hypothetical protein UR56_C0026G0003 [Candidatus Roizmanbacteria bacterium GW2011_GWC2_34_23]